MMMMMYYMLPCLIIYDPGGLPYKTEGGAGRNFEQNPQEIPKSCFGGGAQVLFFIPKRYQFENNTLSPLIFFSTQYPKRYCKTSRCGPFDAEHPKRYENRFFKH